MAVTIMKNYQRERGSQLTPDEVVAIRERYASDPTVTYRQLAKEYEKSPLAIGQAIRGETWSDLPGAMRDNTARSRRQKKTPRHMDDISSKMVRAMLADYNTDLALTYITLAEKYRTTGAVVERVFRSLGDYLSPEQIEAAGGYPKRAVRGARRGEKHPRASLSDAQIKQMRELRHQDQEFWTLRRLAQVYNVCESMVSRVVQGKSRKDAGGPISQ